MQHEWSLTGEVKEYYNENDDGTFKIRVCQNCFMTFQTAPICPYCGAIYETTREEIQNFKQIELKKVEEIKEMRRQEMMKKTSKRVEGYTNPNECRNFYELVEYGKLRNFKPGWAYIQAKRMNFIK